MKKTNDSANVINISKKAYDDFTGRIRHIFIEQMDAPTIAKEVLTLLDRYVKGEEVAIGAADRVVQIAFMMIQPEIDRAIARSKAARLRAAIRKMNRAQAASSVPTQEMQPDSVTAAEASDFVAVQKATERSNCIEAQNEIEQPSEVEAQEETARPVMMNRRARREQERKLRRELKREQRRQARMNSMEYAL